jgi:hypothetical protein
MGWRRSRDPATLSVPPTPGPCVRRYRSRLRPNTASGDSITVQLIQPTDSRSVILIIWPVVVGKFLILEAAVDRSYSVAGPNTRQERRS